jgi:hypothetical protein
MNRLAEPDPIAARALARALHAAGRGDGREPLAPAALEETGVCLDAEIVVEADVAARLAELVERARRDGAAAPIARLGAKMGRGSLLVSGDHVWRLVDAIDDLQLALDALATAAVEVMTAVQSDALAQRLAADRQD